MIKRICLLLLLAGLAGCKIDSVNPISAAAEAQPDPALYGVWRHRSKDELTYVHIGPEYHSSIGDAANANERRTRFIIVDHKPNGLTDESYVAHVSRIGRQRFLNVIQEEKGKPVGFIFVRYTLADRNTLRFSTIDETALKAAIAAGRIRGTTRGEGLSSETAITAESREIGEFLGKEGEKLFAKPLTLTRVRSQ